MGSNDYVHPSSYLPMGSLKATVRRSYVRFREALLLMLCKVNPVEIVIALDVLDCITRRGDVRITNECVVLLKHEDASIRRRA